MTSFDTGRQAEAAATRHLQSLNYEILVNNWRTRWCEIDIVARRGQVVYFVEVKYRRTNRQGGGLDYITPAKLRQMHLAARFWLAKNGWAGDYRLAAVEVSGQGFTVSEFLPDITG